MLNKTLDNNFQLSLLNCKGIREIHAKLNVELEKYSYLLPDLKERKIVLKPNLNSYMNALTGNTTDLRILVTVIEFLKNKGYNNIIIAEGTSSGFYREKINIFERLYIDRLAKFYKVKIIDLNYAPSEEIEFEYGVKAKIAKITQEADLFINIAKLKTHFETNISACLKNMMGALVGLDNKQKAHRSLAKNILNINKYVRPHLHIVDGLIAMEGTGPSSGTPLNLGVILLGTDPFLLDLACAKLAGFNYQDVPYLKIAKEKCIIDQSYINFVDSFVSVSMIRKFIRPRVNPVVKFVNNPKWQHYFIRIRLAPGIRRIFSSKIFGKFLNITGLRQDVFIKTEPDFSRIYLDPIKCSDCKKCAQYCPVGLDLPQQLNTKKDQCISCLYCFLVCPRNAIKIDGDPGFISEQMKRYDKFRNTL